MISMYETLVSPCLSRAALLLSRNSTDDGSSIPTFTLVIPVNSNNGQQIEGICKSSQIHRHSEKTCIPTDNTFLWWKGNDAAVERMLDWKLLIETQEVTETPPHREGLIPEHLQRSLEVENSKRGSPGWCTFIGRIRSHEEQHSINVYVLFWFIQNGQQTLVETL